MWADEIVFADLGLENGVQYSDPFDGGGFTVTFAGGGNDGKYYNTGTGIRVYGNGTMTVAAKSGTLATITVTFSGDTYKPTTADVVDVGTYDPETGTWTGDASSVVFTRPSGTGHWRIQAVAVTYGGGGPVTPTCVTPTFSPEGGNYTSAQNVEIITKTEGATIYYTIDGTDPTANSLVYSSAISVTETTTIKAMAVKDGYNKSAVASATYTIVTVNTEHAGTAEDPYTVADARTAIDANAGLTGVYAKGTVSEIVTSYNDQYGNITFNMSDDGLTTSDQLQAYRCGGAEAANIGVGDIVVISGNLKKYNDTYEFAQGCQIVSRTPAENPAPIITANNVTIEADATSGEIAFSITNPTGATLTAEVTDGDWISNIAVAGNKVTFSATANTGDQRTATITLSYTGASDKVVTITQKKYVPAATLPFAFDGGSAEIASTEGLSQKGLGSYNSSPKLKFDGTGDELVLKIGDAASVLNFDIKGNSFSGGTFTVQTSADGVTYTDLETYTDANLTSTISHESLALTSSVRYIKWIYTNKEGGNVALGRIGVDCEAVTVPAVGYMTVCYPSNIEFAGSGVTAYRVSAIGASYVEIEEIESALAYTPVILKASEGFYKFNLTASPADVGINLLQASDGTATTDDENVVYALASKGEPAVVGFYKVKKNVTVPAGKAYLTVPVATSAPEFLGFGNATDINVVKGEGFMVNGSDIYNLNGQRVANPTKGLYIVNGKKVILK